MVSSTYQRNQRDTVQRFEIQHWGFRDAVWQEKYEDLIHGTCYDTEHVTNETVLERVDQNRKLLAMVKTRKLKYFDHISLHASLEKDIMLRTMPGVRRQGGQRKQWTDDLTEWSNNSIPDRVRMAQDRSAYQRFVYRVVHARHPGRHLDWLIERDQRKCVKETVPAQAWISPSPDRQEFPLLLVVTLQQLHLCEPLNLPFLVLSFLHTDIDLWLPMDPFHPVSPLPGEVPALQRATLIGLL